MSKYLFDEFPPVTSKQWKQKIQFDLKGLDYNKTLLSDTNEGIKIKPFYHIDKFKQLEVPNTPLTFQICQTIFINDEKTAAYLAVKAVENGADSIRFIADKVFNIALLFKEIASSIDGRTPIYFVFKFLEKNFILDLLDYLKNENVFLNIDIIGNLVKSGNWFYNQKDDYHILQSILSQKQKNISTLGVDAGHYKNSGANIVQQIAYTLAHANEYLNFITQNKAIETPLVINFNFSVGGNYFFEIAKLRAFRYLWKLLVEEFQLNIQANIFVEPSLRNKTIYDYNTNMLRTTSECMSAILGGANTISNVAYDTIYHKKNDFGERIARNQLLILRLESKILNSDFVEGTYFIEELTHEIAEKALELFQGIEKNGGFIKQLNAGTIQRKIEESANKEQLQFDSNERILLGINKYPIEGDIMNKEIELYPFLKTRNKETSLSPIIEKRLAENIEKERLANEIN